MTSSQQEKDLKTWQLFVFFIAAFVVGGLIGAVLSSGLEQVFGLPKENDWLDILVSVSALICVYLFLRSRSPSKSIPCDTQLVRGSTILLTLIGTLLVGLSADWTLEILGVSSGGATKGAPSMAVILSSVLVYPILEELVFRGIVLEHLLQKVPAWAAIGISSLWFGLYHLNPEQIVGTFVLGGLFAYLYYRTRSLWLPIIAHVFNNLLVSLFRLDRANGTDVLQFLDISWGATNTLVVLGLTGVSIWLLRSRFNQMQSVI